METTDLNGDRVIECDGLDYDDYKAKCNAEGLMVVEGDACTLADMPPGSIVLLLPLPLLGEKS